MTFIANNPESFDRDADSGDDVLTAALVVGYQPRQLTKTTPDQGFHLFLPFVLGTRELKPFF
jgi:hypothetical protein